MGTNIKHASETWTRRLLSNLEGTINGAISSVNSYAQSVEAMITRHAAKKDNPHAVTKQQVGLGNVDNTSDLSKPVSTAQSLAISSAVEQSAQTKADKSSFAAFNTIQLPDGATLNQTARALRQVIEALRAAATGVALMVSLSCFSEVSTATEWGDVPPSTTMADVCALFADAMGYANYTNAVAASVKIGEARDLSSVEAADGVALRWFIGANTVFGVARRNGAWRIATVGGDLATENYAEGKAQAALAEAKAYADGMINSVTNSVEVWSFSGEGVRTGVVYTVKYQKEDEAVGGWYTHFLLTNGYYFASYGGNPSPHDEVYFNTDDGLITATYVSTVNAFGLARTNDVPDTAALERAIANKASASSLNQLSNTVNQWTAYWDGDDVRVTITNYYGSQALPSLYLEQKILDDVGQTNYFKTVWKEMSRWNEFLTPYIAYTNAVNSELANKADRAWGFYESSSGAYSPGGYTWISSPKIAVAAGLAYQRTITSEGSVWVLESNGAVTETSGNTENGFFKISDDEGNAIFEIVKGNKRTVGATAGSVTTHTEAGITHITINYAVVSSDHPVISVCTSLSSANWNDETSADCVANVSWSGSSGAWVAEVWGKSAQSSLFVKASYEVGGNTYIKNNVATSIDKVVVSGVEYTVTTEVINGKRLLVLQ